MSCKLCCFSCPIMAKGKGGKKGKAPVSKSIDFESDDGEMDDAVDAFHRSDRKLKANAYKTARAREEEEVLNVEGDLSEDESGGDSGDDSSDFDEADEKNIDDMLPSANRWGKKRRDFYDTNYVDGDYGGMNEEDVEAAELEEADARERQRALDQAAALAADMAEDDDEEEEDKVVSVEKADEWSEKAVRKQNKPLNMLIQEYNMKKTLFEVILKPLISVAEHLPEGSLLRSKIQMAVDVYSTYLLNVMYFLSSKAASLSAKKAREDVVDSHPVMDIIEKFSNMTKKVDVFLDKNSEVLNKLINRAAKGQKVDVVQNDSAVRKQKKAVAGGDEAGEGHGEEWAEGEEGWEEDGRRGLPYAIAKNKSMQNNQNKKKKKGASNPRTKKRVQYDKALIRRRSQVPDARKETNKYTGESRGIRAHTIKSTKLKA